MGTGVVRPNTQNLNIYSPRNKRLIIITKRDRYREREREHTRRSARRGLCFCSRRFRSGGRAFWDEQPRRWSASFGRRVGLLFSTWSPFLPLQLIFFHKPYLLFPQQLMDGCLFIARCWSSEFSKLNRKIKENSICIFLTIFLLFIYNMFSYYNYVYYSIFLCLLICNMFST